MQCSEGLPPYAVPERWQLRFSVGGSRVSMQLPFGLAVLQEDTLLQRRSRLSSVATSTQPEPAFQAHGPEVIAKP
jgi:hypothetical protein